MEKLVRIDGDPDVYEVIAETSTTKILVSVTERWRRDVQELEHRLAAAHTRLAETLRTPPPHVVR